MTPHEQRRTLLWTAWCEQLAVLPWVRELADMALAAGRLRIYAETRAGQAEVVEHLVDLCDRLEALDPAWCAAIHLRETTDRWTGTRGTRPSPPGAVEP